ncbi:MAG: T9SS type A sorting domain-containing protein, partial [Betaproteobacteria bacterium]
TLQEIGILAKSIAGGSWTVLSQENCAVASSDTMVSFQGLSDSAPFGHYYCRASADRFDWTIVNIPGFYSVLGSSISLRVLGDAPTTAVAPPTSVPGGPRMTLWPNPAAQEFNIRFSSPTRTQGSLDVFDATGRRVRALYSGEIGPDARLVRWNAESGNGLKVAAGHYWVRLTTGERSRWISAIVVR